MSKSEILYVKGMNISESDGDDDADDDIWDDRKLNDAYDKALRIANAEVAKRVAMTTCSQHGDKDGARNKSKAAASRPTSAKSASKKETHWRPGMPCRAIYDGDGLEYEAFVLRIINDKECIVRFLGYENSEIVSINTLKRTLGERERARQIKQAFNEETQDPEQSPDVDGMEYDSQHAASAGDTEHSYCKKKSPKKKKNKQQAPFQIPEMPFAMPNFNGFRTSDSIEFPLLVPPPMPLPTGELLDSEDHAISSMLVSWYMSGFYTGLYQGLKRSKENSRDN